MGLSFDGQVYYGAAFCSGGINMKPLCHQGGKYVLCILCDVLRVWVLWSCGRETSY